jgi:hypothetical protein
LMRVKLKNDKAIRMIAYEENDMAKSKRLVLTSEYFLTGQSCCA